LPTTIIGRDCAPTVPAGAGCLAAAEDLQICSTCSVRSYRELGLDPRPVLDALRRDLAEELRPFRIDFLAAVLLAAVRALVEIFLFGDRLLVAADADLFFCLVPVTRFFVAEVFLFGDRLLVAADADFCLFPVIRFFAAPITAPETAPITAPATGAPKALPATAPATAPPRVLPAVPLAVSTTSSPLFLSSMFLSLIV
jgi:hypothetical protein